MFIRPAAGQTVPPPENPDMRRSHTLFGVAVLQSRYTMMPEHMQAVSSCSRPHNEPLGMIHTALATATKCAAVLYYYQYRRRAHDEACVGSRQRHEYLRFVSQR